MSVELLTLVALWCGNPIVGHPYAVDASYIGPEVSVKDVNECRVKAIKCLENPSEIESVNELADKCFKQMPYPGRDQQ
jgi:hypothetical protein